MISYLTADEQKFVSGLRQFQGGCARVCNKKGEFSDQTLASASVEFRVQDKGVACGEWLMSAISPLLRPASAISGTQC
jgi:hypothetical protein